MPDIGFREFKAGPAGRVRSNTTTYCRACQQHVTSACPHSPMTTRARSRLAEREKKRAARGG